MQTNQITNKIAKKDNILLVSYHTGVLKKTKDRETSPLEEREEKEKSPLWKKENIGTPSRRKGAINVIEKPFDGLPSISTEGVLKRFLRTLWPSLDFSNMLSIANPQILSTLLLHRNINTRNPNPLSVLTAIVRHNVALNVWVRRIINLVKVKVAVFSLFNLGKEVPLLVVLNNLTRTKHQNRTNNKGGNQNAFNIFVHNPILPKWTT